MARLGPTGDNWLLLVWRVCARITCFIKQIRALNSYTRVTTTCPVVRAMRAKQEVA